jgi:hypothetical protein
MLARTGSQAERLKAARRALREVDYSTAKNRHGKIYRVCDGRGELEGMYSVSLEKIEEWFMSSALDGREPRKNEVKLSREEAEQLIDQAYEAADAAGREEALRLKDYDDSKSRM